MRLVCLAVLSVVVFALSAGCANTPEPDNSEAQVRDAFKALQSAIKDRDAEKIWKLLDADTQTDAERAAQSIQAKYIKGSAKEKTDLEKSLGVSGAELSTLTGPSFIKSSRFYNPKYHEVPDSTLESVKVSRDRAELKYIENDDGTKESLNLVRQDGAWKFVLSIRSE